MRYFLILTFSIISFKSIGFGIGDWQHQTPGGNIMGDPGDGTHLNIQKTNDELLGIRKWYFYNNFIVGEFGKEFFIIDESTGEKLIFKNKNVWTNKIKSLRLEPKFWTRWYGDNWVDGDWLFIWLFFGFFVSIPLILFFAFALYQVIVKERFKLISFYKIFVLFVVFSISSTLILDYYPSSI